MKINPLDKVHHVENNFLEQIATLTPVGINEREITLVRSFVNVCLPGAASFDDENPGADTPRAWQVIDDLIEEGGVCGTFHTHPPLIMEFSDQDLRAQRGLAKANGAKLLWHGVQACSATGVHVHGSYFVCCQMLGDRVFRFHYGHVDDRLSNPVIVLPLPPQISCKDVSYDLSIPPNPVQPYEMLSH